MISYEYYSKFSASTEPNESELLQPKEDFSLVSLLNAYESNELKSIKTLIITNDVHTDILANQIILTNDIKLSYSILGKSSDLNYASLYVDIEKSIVIVRVTSKTLKEHLSQDFLIYLSNILTPKTILCLSALRLSNLIDMETDCRDLFYTKSLHIIHNEGNNSESSTDIIKPLLSNLTALDTNLFELPFFEKALVKYTTDNNIQLYLFLSFRLASLSLSTVQSYDLTIPILNRLIGSVTPHENKMYVDWVKKDTFVYNTELMYT